MDGWVCVRCDRVCTLSRDDGDNGKAVGMLVVVEVSAVMSGVVGACVVGGNQS